MLARFFSKPIVILILLATCLLPIYILETSLALHAHRPHIKVSQIHSPFIISTSTLTKIKSYLATFTLWETYEIRLKNPLKRDTIPTLHNQYPTSITLLFQHHLTQKLRSPLDMKSRKLSPPGTQPGCVGFIVINGGLITFLSAAPVAMASEKLPLPAPPAFLVTSHRRVSRQNSGAFRQKSGELFVMTSTRSDIQV